MTTRTSPPEGHRECSRVWTLELQSNTPPGAGSLTPIVAGQYGEARTALLDNVVTGTVELFRVIAVFTQ